MANLNNAEQQCFKRVWRKTLKSVYKNPTNSMMMSETKTIQQVNVNLKKKRSRRRRKKNKQNICECCIDKANNSNCLISTLNTNGALFLHHVPWNRLNTFCLNGTRFANIDSLKSFLRYLNYLNIKCYLMLLCI